MQDLLSSAACVSYLYGGVECAEARSPGCCCALGVILWTGNSQGQV